jgi:hypothetical protein
MINPIVETEGVLRDDGTLMLDSKPNLPAGRVRVTMQVLGEAPDLLEVLERIHAEQAASGHMPRSREEIDADIAAMRQEDEGAMRGIECLRKDQHHG